MKQCRKCKKLKDESEFYKNNRSKDGLRAWCKKCNREYDRKYHGRLKKYLIYEERHRVVGSVKQKKCHKCKKWKTESDFYKRRRHKDGLAACCKECADKATNKARKQRLAVRN
ncbi:hypothetical protein ACFL1G_05875 [Planctomycetota bacterium]